MPRRWQSALFAVVALAWSAIWATGLVGLTGDDCAEAAREVGKPCVMGQFTYIAATVAVWLVGTLVLAIVWLLMWRAPAR